MSVSNTSLKISDLDFFSIKNNLKDYLRNQSTFSDYDFEGSGLSVLLDVLAYNTYYNSYYMNMIANESFLDTAQIRQNILSHAKLINYVPSSPQGSLSEVNVLVTPSTTEDNNLNVLTLNKYTKLFGRDINGVNYPFVAINSNTTYKSGNSFAFSNVMIKQGEVVTYQFSVGANNSRFEIPSANVDTTTLSVIVQQSSTNTYSTKYSLAENLTDIKGSDPVYFIEENDKLTYSIYFGDNIIGKRPDNGNIVIVTYLDTAGSVANNITKFSFSDPIGGLYRDNVIISSVKSSYGGTDKENIDTIRFRAPQYYTTQNRAVTVNDYESIITKEYNNIDSVSIWGGEDNDPIVYGKVYMSLKTKGFYALSNLEKEQIKNSLIENKNVLTIIPEIVDPDYVFLIIQGKVTYNPSLTSKTSEEIKSIVKNAIIQYNNTELGKFKSTFKKSKLQYYIENSEKSITGSDILIYIQKRIPLNINNSRNYEIKFNAPLKKGDFIEKLYTYPQVRVYDSGFVTRDIYIEEVPNSFTGIDSIRLTNPGSNYETTPTVIISGDGTGATAVATMVGNRIKSINLTNKGINYSRATVSISGGGGNEGSAEAILEARNGLLRTYYYRSNGEKVIVNEMAGIIDYLTGKIIINALTPLYVEKNSFYDTNIMTVNVVPNGDIIPPSRNRILAIDENNFQSIQIEVIAE